MKRGKAWGVGVLVVGLAGLGAVKLLQVREGASFEEQLRLAEREGIPTTAAAYARTIAPATPEENAAPLYREMAKLPRETPLAMTLHDDLLQAPAPLTLRAAEDWITRSRPLLSLIDRATQRPRCWFDRDWSAGAAVMMPELGHFKGSARALALRGSVASVQGRHAEALADADRIFTLARHAGEEGHTLSRAVMRSIHLIGLRELARWTSLHRDVPAYRLRFAKAIDEYPRPDPRQEHRGDLFQMLGLVTQMESAEGRRQLGLRVDDVSQLEWVAPYFINRTRARIQIVQAERDFSRAIGKPKPDRAAMEHARESRDRALYAWPTLLQIFSALSYSDDELRPFESWDSRRLQYRVLLRALEEKAIPSAIDTHDLRSPYDGKPLSYKFDGKEIRIEVSAPAGVTPTEPIVMHVRKGKFLVPPPPGTTGNDY